MVPHSRGCQQIGSRASNGGSADRLSRGARQADLRDIDTDDRQDDGEQKTDKDTKKPCSDYLNGGIWQIKEDARGVDWAVTITQKLQCNVETQVDRQLCQGGGRLQRGLGGMGNVCAESLS